MMIPIQSVDLPIWRHFNVEFSLIRLDLSHPQISGNKWYKLQPVLHAINIDHQPTLLSFGGAYSNHLHALAYAAHQHGIRSIGVIRGEMSAQPNPTLQDLQKWGMELHFVSRQEYSRRYDTDYHQQLRCKFGDFQLIPEGGSSPEAVLSCAGIWGSISPAASLPDYVGCAMGTGATAAGLILAQPETTEVVVVPTLKMTDQQALAMLSAHWSALQLSPKYPFQLLGSDLPYARISPHLAALWQTLFACYGIELDPIYTLRVYHALSQRLLQGGFPPGSKVALLHTGGLQGVRGSFERLARLAQSYHGPLSI